MDPSDRTPNSPSRWRDRASCTDDVDPEVMFPPSGNLALEALAKDWCHICRVKDECLADAVESGDRFGVRGGLSEDERRNLKRRTRRKAGSVTETVETKGDLL